MVIRTPTSSSIYAGARGARELLLPPKGQPFGVLRFLLLFALYLAVPAILLSLLYVVDRPSIPDEVYRVDNANLIAVVSHAEAPPLNGYLPLEDAFSGPIEHDPYTSVWFRMPSLPAAAKALYLPTAFATIEVWRHDELIYSSGTITKPLPFFRTPIFVDLPVQPDLSSSEVLYVRVVRQAENPRPPVMYLGPHDAFASAARARETTFVWLPVIVVAAMLPIMLILGGLFLIRRQETAYAWYSVTLALWALHTLHPLVQHIPINHSIWFALNYFCLTWVATEVIFINRYFEFRTPRLERVLAIVTVSLSIMVLVSSVVLPAVTWWRVVGTIYIPWILLCAIYGSVLYFVALFTRRTWDSLLLWLVSSVVIVVGIRDYLYEYGLTFIHIPGSMYYLQYVALLPLIIFGGLLLARYAASLNSSEELNTELETRVNAKAKALEDSYSMLREEERRRTLAEERTRLMRDMHDGLGGQLIHAIALTDGVDGAGRLEQALRYALDDLRSIVDSLAPDENTIGHVLASFRHRATRSIEDSGMNVRWDLNQEILVTELRSNEALAILRLLQEAINNAVRHSACDTISITVNAVGKNGYALSIRDNGVGLDSKATHGRGLSNMRVRAVELGATISIDSDESGTEVLLSVER